jgi:hypothetical protein
MNERVPRRRFVVNHRPPHSRWSHHHDIGDVMPKWNLSKPYVIAVIAMVMTIVVAVIVLYGLPRP